MRNIRDPIKASLEYFDFIVVAFDKSAGQPTVKVVGDLIEPVLQGHHEAVKASQFATAGAGSPTSSHFLCMLPHTICKKKSPTEYKSILCSPPLNRG